MKDKTLKIYLGVLLIGLVYICIITAFDITIPCFYYTIFGIKCPGCGMTRMFLSLLKLDFVSAFYYNPVVFVLFFIWNIIGVLCISEKTPIGKNPALIRILAIISLVIAFAYGILRNF